MDASPVIIFNFLGFISSAATAYVYEFVHRADSVEGKCIVHLAASLAMAEFVIFMNSAFSYSMNSFAYDGAQIVTTFVLSSFMWSLLLAFHVKNKFKPRLDEITKDSKSVSNDSEVMKKNLLIAYGIPFLVFTCYLGSMDNSSKTGIMQCTIAVDIAILIFISYTFVNVSKNLLRQIDNAQLSLKGNDPVKVDIKRIKHRQQFANTLFQILVLPWLILAAIILLGSTVATSSVLNALPMIGALVTIGLQGIVLFSCLVLRRKRIWKDLGSEYGWTKPDELRALDKMFGYVSEDEDDDEEVTSSKSSRSRWDLLARIHYLTEKNVPAQKETNQQPNYKVHAERRTQNMQPAIHQYVGCGVFPGVTDHADATKKLINETV